MNKPYPPDFQTQSYYPEEDEIELMDLLMVLWKRKYLIIIGTFLCVAAAVVVSLNMTKVWAIKTVLQPGMVKVMNDGKTLYIDTSDNIKTVIESGALNGSLFKEVHFPGGKEKPRSIKFEIKIPKNTNVVEVAYETPHVDIGIQIMKNLNEGLTEKYAKLVEYHREKYDTEIFNRRAVINDQKAIIDATKKKIQILDKTIDQLERQIRFINENSIALIGQRDVFISNKMDTQNILSAILFTNTIQQNIALEKTSRDDLNEYRSSKEALSLEMETAQHKVSNLEMEIKSLQFNKESVQNIQTLTSPRTSEFPVRPRFGLYVLLGGVVGLFLSIFLSFFMESLSKYKKREINESAP